VNSPISMTKCCCEKLEPIRPAMKQIQSLEAINLQKKWCKTIHHKENQRLEAYSEFTLGSVWFRL